MPCVRFETLLNRFGIPRFLKIDIEGRDHLCVRSLAGNDLPEYVSFEVAPDALDLVAHLYSLGYRRFRLIDQCGFKEVNVPTPCSQAHLTWAAAQYVRKTVRRMPERARSIIKALRRAGAGQRKSEDGGFRIGSSGAVPWAPNGNWRDFGGFAYVWTNLVGAGMLDTSWYDVHAALPDAARIAPTKSKLPED